MLLSRRTLIQSGVALAGGLVHPLDARAATERAVTPACDDGDHPTPAQTPGPFFKPQSPLRTSLIESRTEGTRIVLSGNVMSRSCRPVPRALIDIWHADAKGIYDERGYRLRGHQFTADDGSFRFETIVPGRYPGRTPHFHVRVQRPRGRILTTQLYFPQEAQNGRDGLFNPALLMRIEPAGGGLDARFDFVLAGREL